MSNPELILNRYQLGELIGEGGTGSVFRGRDIHSGEIVAIKALNPEAVISDPNAVRRFEQEAQLLLELDHPNIVRVFTTAERNGRHFLVMDYVSGGSLDKKLNRDGTLVIDRILEISLDLADALTRTHRLGIVHRDIKPANVLLEKSGTARLSDFGMAHLVRTSQRIEDNTVSGTLHYLSPEACRGEGKQPSSDIWAFGILLFEMLTGTIPFDGSDPLAVIRAITSSPLPDLEERCPEASKALIDLVYRMLEKDPERRIPSVRLVGAELEAIIQGRDLRYRSFDKPQFVEDSESQIGIKRSNLPFQPVKFVGREKELSDLRKLLLDPEVRLVTVLGFGGMGKSRLALESARELIEKFENGVFFISLSSIETAKDIVPTIADSIGFIFFTSSGPGEQLLNYLREKQMLLIMDNFEHLLDGVYLVQEILEAAPGIKVLATSRQVLNLKEEVRYRLGGMEYTDDTYVKEERLGERLLSQSALQLFVQNVQHVKPGCEFGTDELEDVNRICRLVAGSPLAILLASSWVEVLTPSEIFEEINRDLDFLETDALDMPDRQSSLRAVLASSWKQLSETERKILKNLSVFRGGFTREAAQSIAGADLKHLRGLVNKSILQREASSGRYQIHELIRGYAEEKLSSDGNRIELNSSHCQYYLKFMHRSLDHIRGSRQVETLREIGDEFENIKKAWSWGVDHKKYAAIKNSIETLYVFCEWLNRYEEGEALFQRARTGFSPVENEELNSAWGLVLLPWFDMRVEGRGPLEDYGDILEDANIAHDAALTHDDKQGLAYSLVLLGAIAEATGDTSNAISYYEQGLVQWPQIGDSYWVSIRLGLCYRRIDKHEESEKAFRDSLKRGRELNDRIKIAWSMFNLGETEFMRRKELTNSLLDNVESCWKEAKNLFRQIKSPSGIIWSNTNLCLAAFIKGDYERVKEFAQESLRVATEINYLSYGIPETWGLIANVSVVEGNLQEAEQFFLEWLAKKPKLEKALRSYGAFCRANIFFAILPAGSFILVQKGDFKGALKLMAATTSHPNCPLDIMQRWPGLDQLEDELLDKLGHQEFEILWNQYRNSDIEELLDRIRF